MGFADFLRTIDYFGVQVNFNFKSQKKYTSICGGSIFAVYVILCFVYIAITFISFYEKKHKTVIYYDKELTETDEISFLNHSSKFAINLVCDTFNENQEKKYGKLNDLFKISVSHVKYIKDINGYTNKTKTKLKLHKCDYSDFFNKYNEELDRNEIINNFYCFIDDNYLIKGIYASKDFQYYEFTLASTNDKTDYITMLYENDCKFSLYFIDNAVDVANITHPMTEFLNEIFMQLSPVDYLKFNLYFTIKSFKSDENWFFYWPSHNYYIAYSHSDEYKTAKGENRFISKFDDYDKFGKFYIRASTTRNIIERRFEKLTEYVASSTSLLSAVLLFLVAVIETINDSFAMKDIINTLCMEQKRGIEKKIFLKTKINNYNDMNEKDEKINYFHRRLSAKLGKNIEEMSLSEKERDLEKRRSTAVHVCNNNMNGNDNSNYYDSSQNKIINKNINNLKFLDSENLVKVNNYIMDNFNKNKKKEESSVEEEKNKIKKYYSHDYKNQKKYNLPEIFNNMKNKNNGKTVIESSEQKLQIKEESKKYSLIPESFKNNVTCTNKNSSEKLQDKLTVLNNSIKSSILTFHLFKFFSGRNGKPPKNIHEIIMENSLVYLTRRLDIFNYLKIIKNQEMLLNLLYEDNSYFLVKKFEELYYSSKSTFDENEIVHRNDRNKKRLSKIKLKDCDILWDLIVQLKNKVNKSRVEQRLLNLMIKEINDI